MNKLNQALLTGSIFFGVAVCTPLAANDLNQTSAPISDLLPGYDVSGLPGHYGIFTDTDNTQLLGDQNRWSAQGYLNVDFRDIDIDGDTSRSPLPFDGNHQFAEFGAQFFRESSSGQRWSGELAGIVNDSLYRGLDNGVTLERFHAEWLSPGADRSLRLRGGDFQASWSPRSLQRSLKGVQAEVQTNQSWFDTQHSLQFISGVESPNFRDLNDDRGWFNGVSSLWRSNDSSVIVNLLNHQRDGGSGRADEDQWLLSLGAEHRLRAGDLLDLNIEGELTFLDRDNDSLADQSSRGAFIALNGRLSKILSFDARYEDYDPGFIPAGRSIVNDRRSQEFRVHWEFLPGLRSNVRLQEFIDQRDSANPRTSRTLGANVSGRLTLFNSDTNLSINAFSRERFDGLASIDEVSDNLSAQIGFSSSPLWSHRLRLNYQANEDFLDDGDVSAIELGYNLGRSFNMRDWRGFIETGITVRDIDIRSQFSQVDSEELGLVLSGRLQKGPYRHQLSYRSQDQDREQNNLEDFQREDFSYHFEYRQRQHQFRLALRHFANDPDPGLGLETQEISLSYRYQFELAPINSFAVNQAVASSDFLLLALRPGLSRQAQIDLLAEHQLGTGVPQAGFQVYDHSVFDQVDGRQKLAIESGPAGGVEQSVLLIELDSSDRSQIERDYNTVRKQLVREIGQPSHSLVTGQFADLSALSIQSKVFAREEQWQFPHGSVLLIIPHRSDNRVRLQVHYSRDNHVNGQSRLEFEALDIF